MASGVGNLLKAALERLSAVEEGERRVFVATHAAHDGTEGQLPIIAKLPTFQPRDGEPWSDYRERAATYIAQSANRVQESFGVETRALLTANAFSFHSTPEKINPLTEIPGIDMVELDPRVQVQLMDDAVVDIGLPTFNSNNPNIDGSGVSVAVLDSGIDKNHPHLVVADSVSTSSESDNVPGSHGTHCAGSIASRDVFYPGVAPGVRLINIKVLRADGSGTHTDIVKGIDEALDLEADVLSMSLGFNHLPTWSWGGHGWMCTNGHCPLCTAVDNVTLLDKKLVVVAAGNEHENAEFLRAQGLGGSFDTELGCPGQAREALTVGAITKKGFHPASFSSHGPTSYGVDKPLIVAPGVNITSTVPVPRTPGGQPISNPSRGDLFGRKSGTSMATPIVAGAAALVIQKLGSSWTPSAVKGELVNNVASITGQPVNVVGAGRLDLTGL